jgi:predicted metalloprotease with PDZ domain
MKPLLSMAVCAALLAGGVTLASTGPTAIMPDARIESPKDRPYPGELKLAVDVSDLERKIVTVHEHLTGVSGDTVLLYPQWLPGNHSPSGPIDRIAGIQITANGAPVSWTRDPVNVYALHVHAPAGVKAIEVEFQYLSPTSMKVGRPELSRDVLIVEWNEVVLYPAGYFTRQIPVNASITLPRDWKFGSALEVASSSGARTEFKTTPLETLVDSPLYAGRYSLRLDLDPNAATAVNLDVFADRPELLAIKPEQLAAYRSLVKQAYTLFGSHHYAHYDFLYSLSDQVEQNGLEHHQSSEDGANPEAFTEWNKYASSRDLLSHEYTHSWNGKFRRPADLWTPNYNIPMQDSLLWVYEGQTQYWGEVLAARAGLWTKQQALDQLALTAAYFEVQGGRRWRALEDTTKDPIINPRRPMAWRDWQRFEDYYPEGAMIWLDVDTLIREKSGGHKSLDDFAKAFFGINNGSFVPVTYTFDELVKTLNGVQPYDWSAFLHARLNGVGQPPFEDGLKRGGYKVVFVDTPSDYQKSVDESRKRVSLTFSIGADLDAKESTISSVVWDSPAFKAKLIEGTQLLAVNGAAYSAEILKDAIRSAKDNSAAIELIVKNGDRYRIVSLDYHGGLRYPRLERDAATPARLDDIIAPRT